MPWGLPLAPSGLLVPQPYGQRLPELAHIAPVPPVPLAAQSGVLQNVSTLQEAVSVTRHKTQEDQAQGLDVPRPVGGPAALFGRVTIFASHCVVLGLWQSVLPFRLLCGSAVHSPLSFLYPTLPATPTKALNLVAASHCLVLLQNTQLRNLILILFLFF